MSLQYVNNNKMFSLGDQLTFGKHKGKTLQEVIDIGEVEYIVWCLDNIEWFRVDDLTYKEINKSYDFLEDWKCDMEGYRYDIY